jgi:hypothetical protein
MALSLVGILLGGMATPAAAGPSDTHPAQPEAPEDIPILTCNGTGTGGDQAALRGIRFTVSQSFASVEVRMAGSSAGNYGLAAELRNSNGFTGAPNFTATVNTSLPAIGVQPYKPVRFNLGNVVVSGTQTFTLKFINTGAPVESLPFLEVFGIGNTPCPNVMETDENNVANPTERGDPAGFKVLAPSPASLAITSTYASTPPVIDGQINFGEWNLGNRIPFANGYISVINDGIRLYVLINALSDSTNNSNAAGVSDYFWLSFDKNRDQAITANSDLNYGTVPGTGNMRFQFYLGPGQWTGLQPNTFSSRGRGFGCFFADGTLRITGFFPLKLTCKSHRVWELAFDLAEIGSSPGGKAHVGVRVADQGPGGFADDTPANFSTDFTKFIDVSLAPNPFLSIAPLAGASVALEAKAIELTQAVQNRDNTLPLVRNKTTVARVYARTANVAVSQQVRSYLYASNDGTDLPGSPLVIQHIAPISIDRNNLNHTANFLLPNSWTQGSYSFSAWAADRLGNVASSTPINAGFNARTVPTVWAVPINTGTQQNPNVTTNANIQSQKDYMRTVYPVHTINFVDKPWQDIGPTTVGNTIDKLNTYYNNAAIAWLFTVLFTGKQPFTLPNQVYGFTPSGGGISDPTWFNNGAGKVARGFLGTSSEGTLAHEINHNLDRSNNGTWGRHVPNGCGADGTDPNWPYANRNINEVGFDTRLPWAASGSKLTVIPNTDPDLMSYCQSGHLPTKWISPYRWQNLYNTFAPSAPTLNAGAAPLSPEQIAAIQDVYYITGRINKDGTAQLNPALYQKGLPSENVQPGEYILVLLNASGQIIGRLPFKAEFGNDLDEPIESVFFNYQLPVASIIPLAPNAGPATSIELRKGTAVLASLKASAAPTVTVTAPISGAVVSGTQTVQWTASDPDNDPLSFYVQYSPDAGQSWHPVASAITETQYAIDIGTLPTGTQALFRVIATDGINTAQDDSAAFINASEGMPQVSISSPSAGALVGMGQQVQLMGDATDFGGELPDDAFVWSEGETGLGTGRNLNVELPFGAHTVTLTVVNGAGASAQKSVTFFVGNQAFLPIVLKAQ